MAIAGWHRRCIGWLEGQKRGKHVRGCTAGRLCLSGCAWLALIIILGVLWIAVVHGNLGLLRQQWHNVSVEIRMWLWIAVVNIRVLCVQLVEPILNLLGPPLGMVALMYKDTAVADVCKELQGALKISKRQMVSCNPSRANMLWSLYDLLQDMIKQLAEALVVVPSGGAHFSMELMAAGSNLPAPEFMRNSSIAKAAFLQGAANYRKWVTGDFQPVCSAAMCRAAQAKDRLAELEMLLAASKSAPSRDPQQGPQAKKARMDRAHRVPAELKDKVLEVKGCLKRAAFLMGKDPTDCQEGACPF